MRNIGELVSTANKYEKAVVQQEFKSKKNTVAYVTLEGKPRILKWFVPGFKKGMNIEYTLLKKGSSKLNIPTVFEMDEENNVLVTSCIIGENLSDVINKNEATYDEKQRLMILLAKWFNNFHNFFKEDKEFIIR